VERKQPLPPLNLGRPALLKGGDMVTSPFPLDWPCPPSRFILDNPWPIYRVPGAALASVPRLNVCPGRGACASWYPRGPL